jgi:hypothetical protein
MQVFRHPEDNALLILDASTSPSIQRLLLRCIPHDSVQIDEACGRFTIPTSMYQELRHKLESATTLADILPEHKRPAPGPPSGAKPLKVPTRTLGTQTKGTTGTWGVERAVQTEPSSSVGEFRVPQPPPITGMGVARRDDDASMLTASVHGPGAAAPTGSLVSPEPVDDEESHPEEPPASKVEVFERGPATRMDTSYEAPSIERPLECELLTRPMLLETTVSMLDDRSGPSMVGAGDGDGDQSMRSGFSDMRQVCLRRLLVRDMLRGTD